MVSVYQKRFKTICIITMLLIYQSRECGAVLAWYVDIIYKLRVSDFQKSCIDFTYRAFSKESQIMAASAPFN